MILGVIYCGDSSKQLDNNLRLLNGKPIIAYSIEAARHSRMLDDLIVTTSNIDFENQAIEYGVKVTPIHGNNIINQTSRWAILLDTVERYEEQFGKEISHIVDMQISVPLKKAADIDGAIKMALQHPETDVVFTGYQSGKSPYFNMVEVTKGDYVEIAKKSEEPIVQIHDAPKTFILSEAAFVIRKAALYNYSHWSQALCRIYEIPHERALDINEEFDYQLVNLFLNQHDIL